MNFQLYLECYCLHSAKLRVTPGKACSLSCSAFVRFVRETCKRVSHIGVDSLEVVENVGWSQAPVTKSYFFWTQIVLVGNTMFAHQCCVSSVLRSATLTDIISPSCRVCSGATFPELLTPVLVLFAFPQPRCCAVKTGLLCLTQQTSMYI